MSLPSGDAVISYPENAVAAVLFGCRGCVLSAEEKTFFSKVNPFGFILFSRNIETPDQVRQLVNDLRDCVGRADAPVLVDQEGGRVQRLRPPHWRQAPSAARLAALPDEAAETAVYVNARLIGAELAALGITVDCAPVLDLALPQTHAVIGDRAYAADPERVTRLATAVCHGLRDSGVHPVIKHIPGHGRAVCDSHLELPVVDAAASDLRRQDFVPFHGLAEEDWAMTAHIVYAAFDPDQPATCSATVVRDVIRGEIGFSGLLMSDDLSMQALTGDFADRTRRAFQAGCDMVLHCNGDMAEMRQIADAMPPLSEAAWARFCAAEDRRLTAQAMAPDLTAYADVVADLAKM